jgi:hypothetical protein
LLQQVLFYAKPVLQIRFVERKLNKWETWWADRRGQKGVIAATQLTVDERKRNSNELLFS